MRKIAKLIVLALALMLAVPFGAAFASGEEVVHRIVDAGYYDIWKHSSGTWQQTGKPGDTGRTAQGNFRLPADKLKGQNLTRIEVTSMFGQSEFATAYGQGAFTGVTWAQYERDFLKFTSLKHTADKSSEDLQTGDVQVRWTLDLHPTRPAIQDREALNLKENQHVLEERFQPGFDLANAVEGWRWYLPVMITWYGEGVAVPDFATKLEVDKFVGMKPGQKVTSTVTYTLNPEHPKAETAKLRLDHQVGISEYPITLIPVNPDDAPNEQGVVEFQPGEVKEYRYEFTVQNQSRKITSRINPVSTDEDSDWTNNRDEAIIIGDIDIAVQAWPIMNNYIISWNANSLVVGANIRVTRKDNGDPVNVRLTMKGPDGQKTREFLLGPEGAKTEQYFFTVSNAGTFTITAEAWPVDANDIYPQDNVDSTTITATKQSRPNTGPKEPDLRGELGG